MVAVELEYAEPDIGEESEEDEEQSTDVEHVFFPHVEEEFWSFIYDRQKIWQVRFREHGKRPWTSDLVLHENRFANIYRELDPGTQFLVSEILEADEDSSDIAFNVVMYRCMASNETTAATLGIIRTEDFVADLVENTLLPIRAEGRPIFGSAYRVSSHSKYGKNDHLKNILALLEDLAWDVPRFYRRASRTNNPETWYKDFRKMPGCGPFLSHQCLVDMSMPIHRRGGLGLIGPAFDYSTSYVQAGPGARAGLKRLTGSPNDGPSKIRQLMARQDSAWSRLGLDFASVAATYGELYPNLSEADFAAAGVSPDGLAPISLSNIEGCLCEFAKYAGIKDGTARPKRKYDPLAVRVKQARHASLPCSKCQVGTGPSNRITVITPQSVWPVILCVECAQNLRISDFLGVA